VIQEWTRLIWLCAVIGYDLWTAPVSPPLKSDRSLLSYIPWQIQWHINLTFDPWHKPQILPFISDLPWRKITFANKVRWPLNFSPLWFRSMGNTRVTYQNQFRGLLHIVVTRWVIYVNLGTDGHSKSPWHFVCR